MSVPLSCMIKLSYGGQNMPAIAPESCAMGLRFARLVAQGVLPEDAAFVDVVLDASRRHFNCAPEHVARFAREVVREGVRHWQARRREAEREIASVVWPMAERRENGHSILDAAHAANCDLGRPLTQSEVLAECRGIVGAMQRRRGNARGR